MKKHSVSYTGRTGQQLADVLAREWEAVCDRAHGPEYKTNFILADPRMHALVPWVLLHQPVFSEDAGHELVQ